MKICDQRGTKRLVYMCCRWRLGGSDHLGQMTENEGSGTPLNWPLCGSKGRFIGDQTKNLSDGWGGIDKSREWQRNKQILYDSQQGGIGQLVGN